ncbi:toll/interleukin-1 receptor domain-containing protein [Pseudorhodoferax sp.]|uniref:toll/interleukin-1 receptor domain-containing protein n=1 Tax=Pseudorhodoferax sp. TaxID=1993553 RepID=UPI0039E3948C
MTESDWKRLLRQIRSGYVVPVIGPQLLADAAGASALQRVLAERLLDLHGVAAGDRPALRPFRELNAAVSFLLAGRLAKPQALYVDVADLLDDLAGEPGMLPTPLRQLAEITDLRLFVCMTADGLLAEALRAARPRQALGEVVHAPRMPTDEWRDLPEDWSTQPAGPAWVLYMFGRARPAPVYAIHDEDVLEYAHNVMARGSNVPVNFLRALQDRSLLMLGCGLPDWLGRFFLRLTNKDRLSEKTRHEWLIEAPRGAQAEDELATFLKSFSEDTECLEGPSPAAFVEELHRRWLAEQQPAPAMPAAAPAPELPEVPHGAVFFVSYSRATDAAAAQQLVAALRTLGCGEAEVWFDRRAIEPGEDFAREIMGGIASCRYFLPLLSLAALQREEAFVFREWRAAQQRALGLNRSFVVPLVVDDPAADPARYAGGVADWGGLHFGQAPGGVPDAATLARLRELLRDARNPARAGVA